ncbi:MAG TPA: 1-deoxy-D-xylulose-5-phosphate synthase [Acidimicrobiales bacterium]|nr:1-deoxy-D-xylulose-5-phosphate synthase [Acidimicrobiales bacterium]
MLLDRIHCPADLRRLSHAQLEELSVEIRDFIVDTVERIGHGHLGSNLGAVELTLALHRVFDSPRDILLWDTGHQAYVHKLVTGRRKGFDDLRQAGGLSGYPCRAESEHDWVENSHASTIISYAHGLAVAQESEVGEGRRVVAVIGDGSMTGGMAYEALNNLGHSGKKAIIVLNDNGRSYAPTVSRLTETVSRLRVDPRYVRQRARVEETVRKVPYLGDHLAWGMAGALAGMREMLEPPVFFESLGVKYTGPIDGHDIAGLETALRHAAELDEPIVVHVLTDKGKGHAPAENDPIKRMHDIGAPKPGSYTAAFTEALIKEAENRPELVAITAAMPDSTGLLPFDEAYPGRMIDVGIAEQHAVTSAAGMAMGGLRPVVALYSTFLTRAFDQANLDVGLHGQPVVFCLDRAGITGDDGPSHHGVLDMVLLSKVPGMTMFAPSSYQELQQMLHDALEITSGPVSLRWPKTPAPHVPEAEVGSGLRARKVRTGPDACLVGVGNMLAPCTEAAAALEAEGISCTVWDPRVIHPLDPTLVADAAAHPLVISVEDGYRDGGIGAALADQVAEAALDRPAAERPAVRVMGVPTEFLAQGKAPAILAGLGLDAAGVAAEVRRSLHP